VLTKWGELHELDKDFICYPATGVQTAMVSATLRDKSAYLYQLVLEVSRDFDLERLQQALNLCLQANAILRNIFVTTSQGVFQIQQDKQLVIKVESDLESYLQRDREEGFSCASKAWMRACAIQNSSAFTHVVITIHHALYDGWSLELFENDLLDAYSSLSLDKRPSFKLVADYVASVNQMERDDFWSGYLDNIPLEFQFKFSRPIAQHKKSFDAVQRIVQVDGLVPLAKSLGISKSVLVSGIWALTLRKYLQLNDVVFGEVLSGRDAPIPGIEKYIGANLESWDRL
jgi:hypothetical protein